MPIVETALVLSVLGKLLLGAAVAVAVVAVVHLTLSWLQSKAEEINIADGEVLSERIKNGEIAMVVRKNGKIEKAIKVEYEDMEPGLKAAYEQGIVKFET